MYPKGHKKPRKKTTRPPQERSKTDLRPGQQSQVHQLVKASKLLSSLSPVAGRVRTNQGFMLHSSKLSLVTVLGKLALVTGPGERGQRHLNLQSLSSGR